MHVLQAPLGIAAGCVIALTLPLLWAPAADPDPAEELRGGESVAELRAHGPSVLPELLARFDRLDAGPAKDAAERVIDQVAGQRYATVSRLYWYTDLEAAKAAASAQHKPIISLRLLGRLDEELSCANSRLFRATLYANTEVSALMRDQFILHWSSERDVPKVTIEFGDGRRLERTTTGNSAHFILDETGRVIDVLPGLYAAPTFRARLAEDLRFMSTARTRNESFATLVAQRHEGLAAQQLGRSPADLFANPGSPVARAQRITVGKAAIERRDLRAYARETLPGPDDQDDWIMLGWDKYDAGLDASSLALVERIYTAGSPATRDQITMMQMRLRLSIVGDTALNDLFLRPQISRLIANGRGLLTLDQLIPLVYDQVFHTPRSDAWIGMLPRTDFTGIPGDGVHVEPLGTSE